MNRLVIDCPLGCAVITASENAVCRVHLASRRPDNVRADSSDPLIRECARQLLEYFYGNRRHFDIPLELKGTDFEVAVWKRLLRVPFGQTASYKEIAVAIKRPAAFRAVGAANGKNPIAVIVPCHRIIGHDGRLVGYGGGLWRKRWLLEHESRNLQLAL